MKIPPGGGLGIDLIEIERFRQSLAKGAESFLNRLFTPAEQAQCEQRADPAMHYAARWAAKEACMKALGAGFGQQGVSFLDFEIASSGSEPPRVILQGSAAEIAQERGLHGIHISLTHTDTTAGAVALAI
ncbi:MAG: holo-ACP synthase [Planctomycetes bacterium]|nr:holo-ACP synthase [Planctomycetota bacterium]